MPSKSELYARLRVFGASDGGRQERLRLCVHPADAVLSERIGMEKQFKIVSGVPSPKRPRHSLRCNQMADYGHDVAAQHDGGEFLLFAAPPALAQCFEQEALHEGI